MIGEEVFKIDGNVRDVISISKLTETYRPSQRTHLDFYFLIPFVAFRINWVISFGCDTYDTWLALIVR